MSKIFYDYRVRANLAFDWNKINIPASEPSIMRFSLLIWAGRDDEGWCVFKKDIQTEEVLRIDFYPPLY